MSKHTHYICDHCGEFFEDKPSSGVSSVCITWRGNGASAAKKDDIDLCRTCYSGLVQAIDTATRNFK